MPVKLAFGSNKTGLLIANLSPSPLQIGRFHSAQNIDESVVEL